MLAGIFIISERQFGVGDVVNVGPLVPVGWIEGRVEEVTLRVTKIRTFDGDLFTIANGQLRQTVNLSRDWSRVLITVPVSREADLDATIDQLKGGDAAHNAEAIKAVLRGEKNAFRDIVVLNSAAALMVAGKARDLKEGAALAVESIDGGKARKALEMLQRICA